MKIKNTRKIIITAIGMLLISSLPGNLSATENAVDSPAVSVESVLLKIKQKQNIILVDIRRPKEFEAVGIPGSINIALSFVKTKAYLKSKSVILVNGGFARRRLVEACRGLKSRGVNVRFLTGGLLAWHKAGGMLRGDPTRLQAYTRITPAMLYRERGPDKIAAVDVSENPTPEAKEIFETASGVIHIPFGSGSREKRAFRKAILGKLEKENQTRVVVYSRSGEDYPEIRQLLGRSGANCVFYLSGGLKAYKSYSDNYALLYRPREERVKSTACNNCGAVKREGPGKRKK
jgi:rhodanese-related sulfurtransferase